MNNHLDELHQIANQAFAIGSIEGYLAALLVFQQLSEETIRLLLKGAQFLIQLRVLPNEIYFPKKKKIMFGQLIDELKSTISFTKKDEIIRDCVKMNEYRIKFVHGLTKETGLENLKEQIRQVKDLYENILKNFMAADLYFAQEYVSYQERLKRVGQTVMRRQKKDDEKESHQS